MFRQFPSLPGSFCHFPSSISFHRFISIVQITTPPARQKEGKTSHLNGSNPSLRDALSPCPSLRAQPYFWRVPPPSGRFGKLHLRFERNFQFLKKSPVGISRPGENDGSHVKRAGLRRLGFEKGRTEERRRYQESIPEDRPRDSP